jgi:CelD/BcsL family acetyltransferase involved in cellulose biosynthesis
MADSAGTLRVELRGSPELSSQAWEALADRLGAPPFLRPGWIIAWSRAFARARLSALTAERNGELVGLLPCLKRGGVLSAPANWHTPVFGFLAADSDVSAALAGALLSAARVRADLSFLDRADPNLATCQLAAGEAERPVIVRSVLHSPFAPLLDTTWESYRASLDRKARRDVERRRRRLDEQGSVTVEFTEGHGDLASILDEGFRLEGSGWKRERGTAITSEPRTQKFYAEIAHWARERGWLLLAFLRLDGKPIAFDLCLDHGGTIYVLKGGFDPAFRRFSPGMILTYESLRRALDGGRLSYELLGDDDAYKRVWARSTRERVRFQAFGRSPSGRASHLAWSYGRSALRRSIRAGRGA